MIDILIVTYHRDVDWLRYCLKSIFKFCTGYETINIVVPRRDSAVFLEFHEPPDVVVHHFDECEGKGMLHGDIIKLSADLFCESEFIVHIDSDCFFHNSMNMRDLIMFTKPMLLVCSYETMVSNSPRDNWYPGEDGKFYNPAYRWREKTKKALGFDCDFHTQVRHPMVNYRWVYKLVRNRIRRTTGSFSRYILSGPNTFPQDFNETTTVGSFIMNHLRGMYHVLSIPESYPVIPLWQFWSHGGLDMVMDNPPSSYDRERLIGKTPRQLMDEALSI